MQEPKRSDQFKPGVSSTAQLSQVRTEMLYGFKRRITSIKYKVERDERNLPYIELGRWLCSHFQLETPLNFHKPVTRKLYNVE